MTELMLIGGVWVHDKDRVLLLKTLPNSKQPNTWGPPAGHIHEGETLAETAIRETQEESGLIVALLGLVSCHIVYTPDGKVHVMAFYKVAKPQDSEVVIDPKEVAMFEWATKEEVNSGKYPFRKNFLKDSCLKSFADPEAVDVFSIEHTE